MLKLIKLEWKKNNVKKYIISTLILAALLCLFLFGLTFFDMALDPDTGMLDAPPGYNVVSPLVEFLSNMVYICFSGAMFASFIVSAYKNKTMNLMFSYPIKRQKILLAQMLATWSFSFIALALTKLFLYLSIQIGSKYMQPVFLLDYNLKSTEFYLCLLVSSAVMVSISFVSLYIGLQMRSSKATIISSVVLMFLTQGNIGDFTLAGNTVFYCLLLVVSLLFVVLSIYRVETRDLR